MPVVLFTACRSVNGRDDNERGQCNDAGQSAARLAGDEACVTDPRTQIPPPGLLPFKPKRAKPSSQASITGAHAIVTFRFRDDLGTP